MAQTFDGAQYPDIQRFTLGAANIATKVIIPPTASKATVRFETNAGALAMEGTDAATINANYIVISADASHEFSLLDGLRVSAGVGSFFISSPTLSTVVSVMVEG